MEISIQYQSYGQAAYGNKLAFSPDMFGFDLYEAIIIISAW